MLNSHEVILVDFIINHSDEVTYTNVNLQYDNLLSNINIMLNEIVNIIHTIDMDINQVKPILNKQEFVNNSINKLQSIITKKKQYSF